MEKYIVVIVVFFTVLFSTQDAVSNQKQTKIVIMELFGENITKNDVTNLTNSVENEFRTTGLFDITERAAITEILDQYGVESFEARTVPWIVRIGKALAVDKVVFGSVNNAGNHITISLRMVSVTKKGIENSATETCHICSIDVLYAGTIKKMVYSLANVSTDTLGTDSLFKFSQGPLINLYTKESDTSRENQIENHLFKEWRVKQTRMMYRFGILLYAMSTSLLLLNDIIWATEDFPPDTKKRLPIILSEMSLGFFSIPFFLHASKTKHSIGFLNSEVPHKAFEKGCKVGINISRICPYVYVMPYQFQPKLGFIFGGYLAYNLNHFFALQSELYYYQRGIRDETNRISILYLDYLDFPFSLKSMFPINRFFRIGLTLGLSPAILVRSKEKITSSRHIETKKVTNINYLDIGFNSSVSFEWFVRFGTITGEIQTIEGLRSLGNHWKNKESPQNRSFAFLIGVSL